MVTLLFGLNVESIASVTDGDGHLQVSELQEEHEERSEKEREMRQAAEAMRSELERWKAEAIT